MQKAPIYLLLGFPNVQPYIITIRKTKKAMLVQINKIQIVSIYQFYFTDSIPILESHPTHWWEHWKNFFHAEINQIILELGAQAMRQEKEI